MVGFSIGSTGVCMPTEKTLKNSCLRALQPKKLSAVSAWGNFSAQLGLQQREQQTLFPGLQLSAK